MAARVKAPSEPSPEVKAILREFFAKQREKYGENWKSILAAEMTEQTAPVINALLSLVKKP